MTPDPVREAIERALKRLAPIQVWHASNVRQAFEAELLHLAPQPAPTIVSAIEVAATKCAEHFNLRVQVARAEPLAKLITAELAPAIAALRAKDAERIAELETDRLDLCPHCGVCLRVTPTAVEWSESGEYSPPLSPPADSPEPPAAL